MILFDYEDYEFWVSIGMAKNFAAFSPMHVFFIFWGYERDYLKEKVKNSDKFKKNHAKLVANEIDFTEFILQVFGETIASNIFKKEVRPFVEDYIDSSGYSDHLSEYYKCSIWDLPQNFDKVDTIYKIIDQSMKNYTINKKMYPKLILFDDPKTVEGKYDGFDPDEGYECSESIRLMSFEAFESIADEHDIEDLSVFSPVFVFIMGWAYERGYLEEDLAEMVSELYAEVKSNKIDFSDFVYEALDSKIPSNYFNESVRPFLESYIDDNGYIKLLCDYYQCQLWELPQNFDKAEGLFQLIDGALKKYNES